jgi:hypothetical protein
MAAAKLVPSRPWSLPGSKTTEMSEIAIGNIITVVAVLLIHMLRAPVESITPPIRLWGRLPTRRMM